MVFWFMKRTLGGGLHRPGGAARSDMPVAVDLRWAAHRPTATSSIFRGGMQMVCVEDGEDEAERLPSRFGDIDDQQVVALAFRHA